MFVEGERKKQREREKERKKERERKREREYTHIYMCVCISLRERERGDEGMEGVPRLDSITHPSPQMLTPHPQAVVVLAAGRIRL